MTLIGKLPAGPVDLIGDVHGHLEPLIELLNHLGYDDRGLHQGGARRLVFVGDLIDRGPDSEALLDFVQDLVEAERAHAVLGNHELNVMLDRKREGNDWFFAHPESTRRRFEAFLARLPLALEREDLRVVHACWNEDAIEQLRGRRDVVAAFHEHAAQIEDIVRAHGHDELTAELAHQNDNPIKRLTSGHEQAAKRHFDAGGTPRTTQRTRWWDHYDHPAAVVFGHYWRSPTPGFVPKDGIPYLFDDRPAHAALGPDGRAFCIDYSIGMRGEHGDRVALAALRWPERELVLDSGAVLGIV